MLILARLSYKKLLFFAGLAIIAAILFGCDSENAAAHARRLHGTIIVINGHSFMVNRYSSIGDAGCVELILQPATPQQTPMTVLVTSTNFLAHINRNSEVPNAQGK